MKPCAKCKEIKSFSEYHKNSKRPCGHGGYCKSCCKEYHKKKYPEHKEESLKKQKKKYQEDPEKYREARRKYRQNNKEKIRAKNKEPQERRRAQAGKEILLLLKNPKRYSQYIGCNGYFLIDYLESLFKKGMSWKRRKEIHIDHIIPFKMFDLTNEEERKKCCHYTNLQPLWAKENMEKAAKYISPDNPLGDE